LSHLYQNWYNVNWTKCSNIAGEFIIFIKKLKTNDSMQIDGWSCGIKLQSTKKEKETWAWLKVSL
jgi:hypothetical protein